MSSYCTVFSLQSRSIRQGSGSELELSDFPPQTRYSCKSLFIAREGGPAHASPAGRLLGLDKSVPSCPPWLIVFSFVDFHISPWFDATVYCVTVQSMVSIIIINSSTLLRNCFGCAHNCTILHGSSILAWVLWAMPSPVPAVWRVYTRLCMLDVWVCNDPCCLAEI